MSGGYFTPMQRGLAIEAAHSHIDNFIARRYLTSAAHQEHQAILRARFRASWTAAIASMRRDAKPRRRA